MKTVHKFVVPPSGVFHVDALPAGKVVLVGMQHGIPQMWIERDHNRCSDQTLNVRREFAVLGTGQDVPDGAVHWGSWQSGQFVWHLYEVAS